MNSARRARRWQESGGDYARMAEALSDEMTEELATKSDLAVLRGELEAKIEGVKAELIKWIGGMMIVQALAIVGLVRLLFVP